MFVAHSFLDLERFVSDMYGGRRVTLEPFGYPVNFATLAAAAVGTANLKLFSNADFVLTSIRAAGSDNVNAFNEATLQIVDSGSQEQFFATATPVLAVADVPNMSDSSGMNGLPFPRRIAANSDLQLTLTAGTTTGLTEPQVYLDGVLVYVYG